MLDLTSKPLTDPQARPQPEGTRLQPCRTAPPDAAPPAAAANPSQCSAPKPAPASQKAATPHSPLLTPHSSPSTPHCSLLTPHSSLFTPDSSLLTPHSSLPTPHSSLFKRLAQITILLLTSLTMLGAGTPATRFDKLGHKLMCTCGCAEILLECNHMGCPDSPNLIADLRAQLDAGASDSNILNAFATKYGPTVLAAPIRGGFDLVAWIIPFAVLALGAIGITWLLRHWRDRHQQAALATPTSGLPYAPAPADDLRDRIRRETTYEP